MLKLVKLEWKKNNIGKYIRNAGILFPALCLLTLLVAGDPETGEMSLFIETLSSMSFLVFTSVMLSAFIVSAYKNKTMCLMFSYPIKRQKILISQMLAVWIFNFVALTLTRLLLYGIILLCAHFTSLPILIDFDMTSLGFYIQLIIRAVVTITMSFISLFIGLSMKSSRATITSSFGLIILTQANLGDFAMAENLVLPVILTLISLLFSFLSIHKAEVQDLM
ncbi:MAG: ABC transporter permease [Lachnospiraceae bacterium]|nr:ABC transporter permease [Lachnospiraceae bacterium]